MKKILFLIAFVFVSVIAFAQPIVVRTTGSTTPADTRLQATLNLFIPRYADTTAALSGTNEGVDSCGAIIFTYDVNGFWIRGCSPKRWVQLSTATGATYTNGYGLNLATNQFSVDTTLIQKKLSAGTGIEISGNTIYNTSDLSGYFNTRGYGIGGTGQTITVDTTLIQRKLSGSASIAISNNTIYDTAWFNVKDYGATGNGTTDDAAAINAAINAAHVHGGTVYFPHGIYACRSGLTYYSNTSLIGDGNTSIIKATAAFTSLLSTSNTSLTTPAAYPQNVIEKLYLDGNDSVTNVLFIQVAADVHVRDCFITRGNQTALRLLGVVRGTFENLTLQSVQYGAMLFRNNSISCNFNTFKNCYIVGLYAGVQATRASGTQFYNCDFEFCGTDVTNGVGAIQYVTAAGSGGAEYALTVEGCWFENNLGIAIKLQTPFSGYIPTSYIVNNLFVNGTNVLTNILNATATGTAGHIVTFKSNSVSGVTAGTTTQIVSDGSNVLVTVDKSTYTHTQANSATYKVAEVNAISLTTDNVIYSTPITFTDAFGSWSGALSLKTQTANTVLAGATSGGAAAPTFRALVAADIPSLAGIYEVPLTFSTGLTRTTNTITNNLSTGVSGGQTAIGGTASGNSLTLSSTSNGTKGKLIFGSASAYDEVNDRFGFGTTTPISKFQLVNNNGGAFMPAVYLDEYGTGSTPGFNMRKARGTSASPLAVATNDYIGEIPFLGYANADFRYGADLTAQVESVSGSNVNARLGFWTAASGTLTERFRIQSAGHFVPVASNTYDIGASGTTIKNIYVGSGAIFSAGTTTTAPINLTAGTNLTTPVSGAREFDGTKFFATNSTAVRGWEEVMFGQTSSAGTLTLAYTYTDYVYTGAGTTTWTLPAVSSTFHSFYVKNAGAGIITLNSSAGGNDIYNTALTNTIAIAPGVAYLFRLVGSIFYVE